MPARYLQNPRCASRVFDGEAAIITPGNQRISILNEVATEIWEYCADSPRTVEDIMQHMSEQYDASQNTMRSDIAELIEHLVELGAMSLTVDDVG